ncbi:hypothetical protein [Rufibacter immobilis]|uniref:hypothetical protein n=1 Tax=Rufibacter immobilis TaxID=1348778 RepID=UPI0035ED990E
MGVERDIEVRVLTSYNNCLEFLENFTSDFWTYNQDGTVNTLAADDIDDYDFKIFSFNEACEIFKVRENRNLPISLTLWERDYEDSIFLTIEKLENTYQDTGTHYKLNLSPGYGKRIDGALRYTDYGYYLNQLIPKLDKMGCGIAEFKCQDLDF